MTRKGFPELTAQVKEKLIQRALERRLREADQPDPPPRSSQETAVNGTLPEQYYRFQFHPGYQQLRIINEGASKLGIASPFFRMHDGTAGATTRIEGREYINFASYNYLGFSGDPYVTEAAKAAADRYGTSVSASRSVSGERPVHRKLEHLLAETYGVDDCVVFVSGHATNVTAIGYLFGPKDLILHDALVHNSVVQGIELSGAQRLSFPHNDWKTLDTMLSDQRRNFERVLIVIEGIYSMEGDYPDLPRFIEIKRKHFSFLMVDEAHSFGVMGETGLGIRQHFHLQGSDVDIWMGTLSKALAGCGGFIAGETALVENLKFLAPGFLYSVGMSPPVAAASAAALERLLQEPARVKTLQQRGRFFRDRARAAGINTGSSMGLAIVPAITGSSVMATRLSQALFEQGINVQPILYPAVPEKSARLRFFINCQHTEDQLERTVQALVRESAKL